MKIKLFEKPKTCFSSTGNCVMFLSKSGLLPFETLLYKAGDRGTQPANRIA